MNTEQLIAIQVLIVLLLVIGILGPRLAGHGQAEVAGGAADTTVAHGGQP